MATKEERRALLATPCDWCGAAVGEECTPPLTTLDGGCHDARWRKALQKPAPIMGGAVPRPTPKNPSDGNVASIRGYLAAVHA